MAIGSTMRRARRTARAVLHGQEILSMVSRPEVRTLLAAAAAAGHPPVTAISEHLVAAIGASDAKLTPVKQFAGVCVRAVLEEEGFEVAATGVRLSNDPVFRTGAVYRNSEPRAEGLPAEPLRWFVKKLTDEEAEVALDLLNARVRRVRL